MILTELSQIHFELFYVGWQKEMISQHRRALVHPDNLIEETGNIIYGKTVYKTTDYGRTWYHIYFDPSRKEKVVTSFMQTVKGKIFLTFVSLIILAQLRKMVIAVDAKKRKYWSEQDMLRKVETNATVHFEGKYKDVYTTPTAGQRLVFDIFGISYNFKGENSASETSPK